jgi:hypothetical protein
MCWLFAPALSSKPPYIGGFTQYSLHYVLASCTCAVLLKPPRSGGFTQYSLHYVLAFCTCAVLQATV